MTSSPVWDYALELPSSVDLVSVASSRAAREIQLTQEEWQGRNTWMMWTGGNSAFWDLLARESNGLVDLLKLLDARHIAREDRFPHPGACAGTRYAV